MAFLVIEVETSDDYVIDDPDEVLAALKTLFHYTSSTIPDWRLRELADLACNDPAPCDDMYQLFP